MSSHPRPRFSDIEAAYERIRPSIHRTPVLACSTFDRMFGAKLFFKCENFQKVGAFKMRGAANAVLSLSDEIAKRGVATHSSGNHAQALALAAKQRRIPAYIVMPKNAPQVKRDAVAGYGALITLCEPTMNSREAALKEIVAKTGAEVVHPYDDARVIAGQGTAAYELVQEIPDLDLIIAPVSGGGLLSGTAIAAKGLCPIQVYGAEPSLADDAFRSFRDGKLYPGVASSSSTIADGLRASLSELTFSLIQQSVDGIWTAQEESIKDALRLVFERMKIVIEPSSAVPLATLLEDKTRVAGKKVGIIFSGGNIDLPL